MEGIKFDRPVTSVIMKASSHFPNQKLEGVTTTGSIDNLCPNSSGLNCERPQTLGLEVCRALNLNQVATRLSRIPGRHQKPQMLILSSVWGMRTDFHRS